MKIKLIFAALFAVFAIVSASAQTKVDKYLGTWKLTSQPKTSYKSVILNVSIDDESLKVEKIAEYNRYGKDYSGTTIFSYKLSGGTSTFLPFSNTYGTTYLRYLSDDKLRLVQTYDAGKFNLESLASASNIREDWSLSGDGKTLTVDIRKYSNSSKFVYAKQ